MSRIPPQIESPAYWVSYLTLNEDVKPFLNLPSTPTPRDWLLQTYLDAACDWVQATLNQPVAPTEFFRRFNGYSGYGGSMIDLPYFPGLDVPTVIEYWGASGSRLDSQCTLIEGSSTVQDPNIGATDVGAYVLGPGIPDTAQVLTVDPGVSFTMTADATMSASPTPLDVSGGHLLELQTPEHQGNSFMFTYDAPRGILFRSYLGLLQEPFFPGLKNIEVWWRAGRSPIPLRWRLGTLKLIKYWWESEQALSPSFTPEQAEGGQKINASMLPLVPDSVASMFQSSIQIGFA